jgi:fatty-acyl-CoA synthase
MGFEPESRLLGHMPFFHVAGAFSGLLPALISGGAVVLLDHWDTRDALELIERERITVLNGIPTHFIDLLNAPELERYDTSSLRTGWIGGAANPPEVIDGVIEKLGVSRLLPVYGMTETTSVTTFPRPDDPRDVVLSGKGVPVSDFELKVVDLETGEELGVDAEGEVCVRGHSVMQGYYRDAAATGQVIDAAGWFHTGDLGVLDADGYLAITGRKSDMFIVGGSNVYPAEVELALAEHAEITQAYVVGITDHRLGEVGYAFVQRRSRELSEVDVVEFCRNRLADFKVPRHVQFVDEWPLTATGKIQRFRLRELAAELGPTDRLAKPPEHT